MKTKITFLLLVLCLLLITGCSSEITFEINQFDLIDESINLYSNEYSNDTEQVELNDNIILTNNKANVKFFSDEERFDEILTKYVLLSEGDNYVYVTIDNGASNINLILNFYRLSLFKVTFVTSCQTKIDAQYIEENGFIVEPTEKLEKFGYCFTGWDYDINEPVTDNIVINAVWEPNAYTVKYDVNGGTLNVDNKVVYYGKPYELDIPEKDGYKFIGWEYDDKYLSKGTWYYDEDISVVAKWEPEPRTYEIEYIIDGEVIETLPNTYSNQEEFVLQNPYKKGFTFIGWFYEEDCSGERIMSLPKWTEGNITLYSKWEAFTLEGKKISFVGDSISTFYSSTSAVNSLYSGENQFYYPIYSATVKTVDKTWWYQVVQGTNTTLLVNESWSGTACYNNGNENNSGAMNYNRINNLKGSEIVVILIGTNDNVNGHSTTNFKYAYDTMLQRIKEVCPDAFIFCLTLGYSAYTKYYYTEETRIEYNDIIRNSSEKYGAQVVEISEVQTKDNYNTLLGDALHLNAEGMKAYADKVIKAIKDYFE